LKILANQFDARAMKCVSKKENMVCKFKYIIYKIVKIIYLFYKIVYLFYIILLVSFSYFLRNKKGMDKEWIQLIKELISLEEFHYGCNDNL